MQRKSKVVSFLLVTVLLFSFIFPTALFALDNNAPVDRIYGADRYETALNVAKTAYPAGAETVVLAPGAQANLVDALTAAPLAYSKNAPILLTKNNELPSSVKSYLALKTETVYVVSKAISSAVIDELTAMDIEVIELGGNNRFHTATNIAEELENVTGIFVTTGVNNADALSIAPIAAANGMPILLTNLNGLPAEEAAYLKEIKDNITQSYVIGGLSAVPQAVEDVLPGEVLRISGNDRFLTNLAVLETFYAGVPKFEAIFAANGTNAHLADALVASTLAAAKGAPMVLVNYEFDAAAKAFVDSKLSANGRVTALGGEAIVAPSVLTPNYVRAEDFGVVTSAVNGYSVGFRLLSGTDKVAAIEVSLFDQHGQILAKNVSRNKLFSITGNNNQFSSPFNINGSYAGDDYWDYGEWAGSVYDIPAKAVITVHHFDGQTFTVENTNLTGNPEDLLTEDEKHLKAEDFGVVTSAASGVYGYSVGFSLIDGKDASDLSAIEISLYDENNNLLAKNTATHRVLRLTATQLSSPFNIDGPFADDGYWNYGAWNGTIEDIPAKAVIKVTYANGRTYTVENTKLTGDPAKLRQPEITTSLADNVTVGNDIEYSVSTVANRYTGQVVRVKTTLTEGNAQDFALMYQEGDEFKPLPFKDGVAWFGPAAGFPFSDATSNFKINFQEAGTYTFKVEVVRLSDGQVLATATQSVTAETAE
ncbi:MAG TPA: cell wall-binding repeat-containing protein [Peptococcaceae bacterium]|nr:cell wall-binding repeat-containing protein [Peptococcaceae bacterium]